MLYDTWYDLAHSGGDQGASEEARTHWAAGRHGEAIEVVSQMWRETRDPEVVSLLEQADAAVLSERGPIPGATTAERIAAIESVDRAQATLLRTRGLHNSSTCSG